MNGHDSSNGEGLAGDAPAAGGPVRVLVVDDEAADRLAMQKFLERGGFDVETSAGLEDAVARLKSGRYEVVVLDIYLQGATGFELLERLRADGAEREVILVTGHADVETVLRAMRQGVSDLLVKPITPERLCGAVQHAARMKVLKDENRRYRERIEDLLVRRTQEVREGESRLATIVGASLDGLLVSDREGRILFLNPAARRFLNKGLHDRHGLPLPEVLDGQTAREVTVDSPGGPPRTLEARAAEISWARGKAILVMLRDVTDLRRAAEERAQAVERTLQAIRATAESLASVVEMRDPYTSGHQRRVTMLACAIHEEMGLPANDREGLRLAGTIHDLGKLQVPTEILVKPARLTDLEYRILQGHARAGYDILKNVDFPWPVATMVLQHHERLDGSGYPDGVMGDAILVEARILGVADVVEAMASHRPYRPALGLEAALAEVSGKAGTLYDPDVARACVAVFRTRGFRWS